MLVQAKYTVLEKDALPLDGYTREFEGRDHADIPLSFLWVDMPVGRGVRLHKHPYREIFIIQDGTATYTVGPATLEAHAGQVIVVEADTPHNFMNTGRVPLRQVDIHLARQFVTDWLEE
jgi:mannose-6-phosphate isomerase-like protein (cupin superfamily)